MGTQSQPNRADAIKEIVAWLIADKQRQSDEHYDGDMSMWGAESFYDDLEELNRDILRRLENEIPGGF